MAKPLPLSRPVDLCSHGFKIDHRDAQGADIVNIGADGAAPFEDEREIGNMLVRYIRSTDIYPGDVLTVVAPRECR